MPLTIEDTDDLSMDAPRPIDAESIENGSFERLGQGEGAVSAPHVNASAANARRKKTAPRQHVNASDLPAVPKHEIDTRMGGKRIAIIAVAALAVIAVGAFLAVRVLNSPVPDIDLGSLARMEVAVDEPISFRGSTYELVAQEGSLVLVEDREDGTGQTSLGELPGTPVSVFLFDGALVFPENLSDGSWDVVAYTAGTGWNPIVDREGSSYAGKGSISQADLVGTDLQLVVDGTQVTVPLVW